MELRGAAECRVQGSFHISCVRRPGGNHIDGRRRLSPRDYFDPPESFGVLADARARVPAGGDTVSAAIALVQHRLVVAWRRGGCQPSGAAVGRQFSFSKQTFSRTILGERWMGETLMAALLDALQRQPIGSARHELSSSPPRRLRPMASRGTGQRGA